MYIALTMVDVAQNKYGDRRSHDFFEPILCMFSQMVRCDARCDAMRWYVEDVPLHRPSNKLCSLLLYSTLLWVVVRVWHRIGLAYDRGFRDYQPDHISSFLLFFSAIFYTVLSCFQCLPYGTEIDQWYHLHFHYMASASEWRTPFLFQYTGHDRTRCLISSQSCLHSEQVVSSLVCRSLSFNGRQLLLAL